MSKEIAQTVGGKRIAWLLAILAAFAVMATLGTQWRTSSAALPSTTATIASAGDALPGGPRSYTVTFAFNPNPSDSAGGGAFTITLDPDLVGVAGVSTVPGMPTCTVASNVVTCATAAAVGGFANGTVTITATNPLGGGTIDAPTGCQIAEGTTVACTGTTHAQYAVANAVPVSADATNVRGVPHTFTFGPFPAGYTCASDTDADSVTPECTLADVNVSTGLTKTNVTVSGQNVLVTVINSSTSSTGGTVSLNVATSDDPDATPVAFTSAVGTKAYVAAALLHIADNGQAIVQQEVNNNVRGSRHVICTFADESGVISGGVFTTQPTPIAIPGITLANIVLTAGGGPGGPTFSDVTIYAGTGGNDGPSGATCISWRSLDAGDQTINLLYVGADGQQYNVLWDSRGAANSQGVVKEWNRLEDSRLTVNGTASTAQDVAITVPVVLNPVSGLYQGTAVTILDTFRGSHTNSAAQTEGPMSLAGVVWNATELGCGSLVTNPTSGTTTLLRTPASSPALNTHQVGNEPNLIVDINGCAPGMTSKVTITGQEPGPLGSGTGNTVTETVTITFTAQIPAKHVFLAWAGQRVVLEHNWALDAPTNNNCPLEGDQRESPIHYVKGSGPGNFLPGGTMNSFSATEAWGSQTFEDEWLDDCISVAVYESEDQGQVDIEAFIEGAPASKVAFVVYYMKINTINVSLVTQVSKPTHNGSAAPDWAPGNPWDASKDDADNAAEWNVSKDLLVRGRVTGWFVNSNPSGRARDDSNPLNVLPADRWVMPQDWPLLAGGPGDGDGSTNAIGTAEQFRPYYDIMIDPDVAKNGGRALQTPLGNALVQVAAVAAGNTGVGSSTSPIAVTTCGSLAAGNSIVVGITGATVGGCASNLLVLATAMTSAPAAGTGIYKTNALPFVGPYSALDIVGLSADGFGSNAPYDSSPWYRDTAWKDGDVDMWDAPMPPALASVAIRGTGFIKQVLKQDVYYLGTPNVPAAQIYPNPFYYSEIPESPFIPAVAAGGGYFWNSWGGDGAYQFWQPVRVGVNSAGIPDSFTAGQTTELNYIRTAYGNDNTIARDLVVYTDNHGEFMVAANGDYRTDLTACATNVLAGGKHCARGDKVGTGTITATVDYPDFRGKHFPVLSNAATVDWTWGGYKDVTVEDGETDQFKYIVFHGMDRDGFCNVPTGAVSLHPVYSSAANNAWTGIGVYPPETIDFLIDSGEGIIIDRSGVTPSNGVNDGKQFATGLMTFSLAVNNPALAKTDTTGNKEFPLSPLAAEGQTDECQAWIKVSNSLLGVLNVLTIAHDDEGNIGFDRVIDLTNTHSYSLSFRWSLITWIGANAISVNDAITGTGDSGANPGGNDISASVTAIYGWDASAQQWLGFFPSGVNVPGANDLTSLSTGDAYWIAITGPSSVTWTIASNVN